MQTVLSHVLCGYLLEPSTRQCRTSELCSVGIHIQIIWQKDTTDGQRPGRGSIPYCVLVLRRVQHVSSSVARAAYHADRESVHHPGQERIPTHAHKLVCDRLKLQAKTARPLTHPVRPNTEGVQQLSKRITLLSKRG
eukprot:3604036-Rhodomonas_salina.4